MGVSNSNSQKEYILFQARERGLKNIEIVTADMNQFEASSSFDRVVSVEMFEHMRNWELLLKKVSHWLKPEGLCFIHIFCHKNSPYFFEIEGDDNWMGKYFFTGGLMPSESLFAFFQNDLRLERLWRVSGNHYSRTCEEWLKNHEKHKREILQLFEKSYGLLEAKRWYYRWKIFFLACSELFRFNEGNEWFGWHYLFKLNPSRNLNDTSPY